MKYLDYELIRNHPKVFVGYSDITNLLNAFSEKCGFVTYHGPMVSSNILEHYDDYTRESFLKTIGDWEELEFANDTRPLHTITGGRAEGRLIGGNVRVRFMSRIPMEPLFSWKMWTSTLLPWICTLPRWKMQAFLTMRRESC